MPGPRQTEILDLVATGGMHVDDLVEQATQGWPSRVAATQRRIGWLAVKGWLTIDNNRIVRRRPR